MRDCSDYNERYNERLLWLKRLSLCRRKFSNPVVRKKRNSVTAGWLSQTTTPQLRGKRERVYSLKNVHSFIEQPILPATLETRFAQLPRTPHFANYHKHHISPTTTKTKVGQLLQLPSFGICLLFWVPPRNKRKILDNIFCLTTG